MRTPLTRLRIEFNPFEPAASGAPEGGSLWLPSSWRGAVQDKIRTMESGGGPKCVVVYGEYGSGKSYILQWLKREIFPDKRIRAYYFDNPGVQFYDLANSLLRQIGRKDLAKSIWELVFPKLSRVQPQLFPVSYEGYLMRTRNRDQYEFVLDELQEVIRKKIGITDDEQIAHCLARLVAETPRKPYFEYRDFIAGRAGALVAEGEAAHYFQAILRTLRYAFNIESVAFLIDEFEEVAAAKRLTRKEAHEYLLTLKRLINLATGEDLWVVLAMTPDAVEKTRELEPATWDRFADEYEIPPLTATEAAELIKHRLGLARGNQEKDVKGLFPFDNSVTESLKPTTWSSPRKLVKLCFYAISEAKKTTKLPFGVDYLQALEKRFYPDES